MVAASRITCVLAWRSRLARAGSSIKFDLIIFCSHGSMQSMENKMTRREMGLLLGGLGMASAQAEEKKPGTIHFDVDYKTKPERIYQALLDVKQFSAFSGLPAE